MVVPRRGYEAVFTVIGRIGLRRSKSILPFILSRNFLSWWLVLVGVPLSLCLVRGSKVFLFDYGGWFLGSLWRRRGPSLSSHRQVNSGASSDWRRALGQRHTVGDGFSLQFGPCV
ncbi:hypothetical protein Rs2_37326 [Raphanus sativus]|nr:hypothetical protein Rs2_37326 [Raphanus sativus]